MGKGKIVEKDRVWAFTEYDMDMDFEEILDQNENIRWIGCGWEICPTTLRPHWQGCVYLHNACGSLETMKEILPEAHWGMKKKHATFEDNVNYCSKGGLFEEWGDKPDQGKRIDLIELKERIMDGASVDDIALENPVAFHQYGRTLERLQTIRLRRQHRTWYTQGIWVWGPSGVGKSHMAFENYSYETHYIKNLNEDWWDGYTGQEVVILNEYKGQLTLGEIFDLVDKWPKTVKYRNREPVPFLAKTVYITSSKNPYEMYTSLGKEEKSIQFERRFKTIYMEQKCLEGNTELLSDGNKSD